MTPYICRIMYFIVYHVSHDAHVISCRAAQLCSRCASSNEWRAAKMFAKCGALSCG